MATDARAEILGRVRAALGPRQEPADIAAEWASLDRRYRRASTQSSAELLHLLEDRLRDYDAGVHRCSADEVAEVVARVLAERGKQRMAVPAGVPAQWMPAGSVVWIEDLGGNVAAIDACDGVLTTATLAIAETGSIVLQDVPGQGRRAVTLLPDYHLCLVEASTIVATVPEALAKLHATAGLATTFFSGPSATADIEMTRIKGVHGPRFVDVVLVLA